MHITNTHVLQQTESNKNANAMNTQAIGCIENNYLNNDKLATIILNPAPSLPSRSFGSRSAGKEGGEDEREGCSGSWPVGGPAGGAVIRLLLPLLPLPLPLPLLLLLRTTTTTTTYYYYYYYLLLLLLLLLLPLTTTYWVLLTTTYY